jgi:predicted membrane protein
MENQKNCNHSSRKGNIIFWSIVLVVTAFFFLKKSGLIASVYFSAFLSWPLLLLFISCVCLFKREWVAGIITMAGALFFWTPIFLRTDPDLIPCVVSHGFINHYWYLLLIFIAIVIIIQQLFSKGKHWEERWKCKNKESNTFDYKDGFIKSEIIFSSNERIYLCDNFKGGKFDTVFGSQEIDLRKCEIPNHEKAIIDISVVFGTVKIWVPAEWTVQINTESVFSGLDDKRLQNPTYTGENDMLVINGKCVFSNLEIRS